MYRADIFKTDGAFKAPNIPYCPQFMYDNYDYESYENMVIVQNDRHTAFIEVGNIDPTEARKIDYVILVNEEDESDKVCFWFLYPTFTSEGVATLNLQFDWYNTMGGFIKGSNDNVVIAGSAKRLTVPLNYKAGVYPQADNKDFFGLAEPFEPTTKLLMKYDNFKFNVLVPDTPQAGEIGVVRQYIEVMQPDSDKNLASYINKAGFNPNSIYFDSQNNANLTSAEYQQVIDNELFEKLTTIPNGGGRQLVMWTGTYYGYASATNNYWYLLTYDDSNYPKNLAEFSAKKDILINKSLNLLSANLVMNVTSGDPPTVQTIPATDMIKYMWLILYTRALELWELKIRTNYNIYGSLPEWAGQKVHVGFRNLADATNGYLKLVNGTMDLSQVQFLISSRMYKTGGSVIPTTETIEYVNF